ncbi:benzoate 4-monooxygenase cytochrome P450 [Blastomyces gilchristii SLH14081]|uniref:Benzoate 4-monooxygenase cytochrome P450 n=1 Tax=Blastomyces gilchristii (strain SLH14081) TaxID=559298 RepID=A0A179UV54_BLAGS|nr:benzoate 4-monooxygenase cytochrome P450 [Blastomyces gilchristii SLH14081]OAT12006.1 benzoate 4-monooxygenase cytochrome P450 [Blastomyces gilchristii SLH14081]
MTIIHSEFLPPHLYYAFPTTWLFTIIILISATAAVSYMGAVVIYRLYFHPLSHIPGPRLAAATHLYNFYYNGICSGRLYLQIEKLHRIYGPVIRISPAEIHLSDPENYDRIYRDGNGYAKPHSFYNTFLRGSLKVFTKPQLGTCQAKHANAAPPLFSPRHAPELESIIQAKAGTLERRIRTRLRNVGKINLHYAFRAMSVDIVTQYASDGKGYGFLGREDFGKEYFVLARQVARFVWAFQQFPTLMGLLVRVVPVRGVRELTRLLEQSGMRKGCFNPTLLEVDAVGGQDNEEGRSAIGYSKADVYDALAIVSHMAGNPLTITAYNTVVNKEVYRMLKTELTTAFPDPKSEPTFAELEKLPFLTAVIKEGFRLSYGMLGRLPRVVPEPGAEFNGYRVPAGTSLHMSSWVMHRNEELFPEPDEFDPSRWLGTRASSKNLEQYLVMFSKGSGQCMGLPLAYCEMYIALARLFRHFNDLTIEPRGQEDPGYDDFFTPYHRPGKEIFCFAGSGCDQL